jgi:3-methyl-2-oxobutanoate hydroxymethyltransferase
MSRALLNTLRASPRPSRPTHILASSLQLHQCIPLPVAQVRSSSHSPIGAAPANARKPVTINTLQSLYRKNEPITMITAHDFPSAHVADHAGMDMILVGDSLAMVALGMEDTSEVLMEEMLLHCKSVARATKAAFTVHTSFLEVSS